MTRGSEWLHLRKTNLGGTNLHRSDLGGANLYGANLGGANLRANLYMANLGGTNLHRSDLGGANLYGANLIKANATDIENLTSKQIKSACNWENAIYKGEWDWDEEAQTWIANNEQAKQDNRKYIEDLKKDPASDPKEKPDCSKWTK